MESGRQCWSCLYTYGVIICLLSVSNVCIVLIHALEGNETDRIALSQFKAMITDDPLGVTSSWNSSNHFCQWRGVTCGHRHKRVTVLDLRSLQLSGSISPYIGNLSFLRELYLINNSFSQHIPSEIGYLRRLEVLTLANNSIGGEIPPNISMCSNLVRFSVSNNRLEGKIPEEFGSLSKLQNFIVTRNNITGNIPLSFANLSSLVQLSAASNRLSGKIPDVIGQFKSLQILYLPMNGFYGTIPPALFNLSSLTDLYLGFNQLEGSLPSDLGILLPNLHSLEAAVNRLSGSIPPSLSNATNLEQIQLQMNNLTGTVPPLGNSRNLLRLLINFNSLGNSSSGDLNFLSSLTNASTLDGLMLDNNNFGGAVPENIANLSTSLTILHLDNNKLTGTIPTGLENLVNLQRFVVSGNFISGSIPSIIGKLKNLELLDLSENELSGNIPIAIGNLTRAVGLLLSKNTLQGRIPASLGNCENLNKLNLSNNNLTGSIPSQILSLPSLSIFLDLSNNHLTGTIPVEIENLKNLGSLDVSYNMLSGNIPSNLGSCIKLESLYMQSNAFRGPIPSSLSSLRGIQEIDVSQNHFSGKIPEFVEGLRLLRLLNLSYNDFEGEVPTGGVFANSSATFLAGNAKICGVQPNFHLPKCTSERPEKSSHRQKIVIPIVFGLTGVALLLSCVVFYLYRKRRDQLPKTISDEPNLYPKLSYTNLSKATNGFSESNLIGVGSFGSVHKGVLDQTGTIVAVKVINLLHRGASKSFMAECEALRNIRHRNLVKIVTACSGVDHQRNDFKALVYEFMVNGSLDEWLHPIPTTSNCLNFLQRVNIAIDIASALDYLHNQLETPIVHHDLKPSNVLLDNDMTAHVGDFGLAKFLVQSEPSQVSSTGVRGTVGYAAPEYGLGGKASTFGDIYSYGILLLEMFTGKRPTDNTLNEDLTLHNFVRTALPERVGTVVDPILLHELAHEQINGRDGYSYGSSNNNIVQYSLISILEIGLACSVESPQERKHIQDVVVELNSIRRRFV